MTEIFTAPIVAAPLSAGVPQRELGYSAASQTAAEWWNDLANEKVPELRWPALYDVYDAMMTTPQIASIVWAVLGPILGAGWRIDGTGCRPDITQHVANDLSLPIVGTTQADDDQVLPADDKFTWAEHAELALDEYLRYGHSIYEQKAVWGDDELWHLSKLGWRDPRTITRFNTARDGGLISIEQTPDAASLVSLASKPIVLSVGRIVIYSRRRRGAKWRGQSMLRPAYQPYLINQRAQRVEMVVVERFGGPVVVYEAGEGETDLTKGQEIARKVRVGQEAGVAVPHGASVKMVAVEGTMPDVDKTKRYNDEKIAQAALAHHLNLGQQSGTGSYALGATFFNAFMLQLQATASEFARVGSRHVVRDLVAWNWPGERAPRLVFDEIGTRVEALVQALSVLVNAGVLTADQNLEDFVRTTLGVPNGAPNRPQPQQEAS